MTNSAAIGLTVLLLTTGAAHAAGGMQLGSGVIGPAVQYQPSLASEHSASIPGFGGGDPDDQPSSQDILFGNKNKNLPDDSIDTPGVDIPAGTPGIDTQTASTGVDITPAKRRGQFALTCELKANGDIVFANVGNGTLDGGVKIKWSARGRQGYFALTVDLPASGRATAADVFDTAKTAPCLASVL